MSKHSFSNRDSSIFSDLMLIQSAENELLHERKFTTPFEPLHQSIVPENISTQWAIDVLVPSSEADLVAPSRQIEALTELQALRHAAYVGEQQKRRGRFIRNDTPPSEVIEATEHYAEPLSPLKQRDLKALAELFQREDIYTIETDVAQLLLRLLPEPCWEDDPFEFLKEFL